MIENKKKSWLTLSNEDEQPYLQDTSTQALKFNVNGTQFPTSNTVALRNCLSRDARSGTAVYSNTRGQKHHDLSSGPVNMWPSVHTEEAILRMEDIMSHGRVSQA